MATVTTSLNFAITSAWDGAGLDAARKDFLEFRNEVRAMAKEKIGIGVDLDGLEKAKTDIAELTDTPHDVTLVIRSNAEEVNAQIDRAARDRTCKIVVTSDAATIRRDIDNAARDRSSKIKRETENVTNTRINTEEHHKVTVDADTATFEADIHGVVRRRRTVRVDGDVSDLEASIDRAIQRRKMLAITGPKSKAADLYDDFESSGKPKFIPSERADLDGMKAIEGPTITAKADTAVADAQINKAARDRQITIFVKTDTNKAKDEIEKTRKSVGSSPSSSSRVTADTSQAESALSKLISTAAGARLAVLAIGAALTALGPIAVATGAILAGALGGGVIVAGLAAIEINKKVADSHNQARLAAQEQADSANRELADAYRNVQDTAVDGAQKIEAAEHNVVIATREEEDARKSLTEAYKDARRELEDLQLQLEAAPVNERAAVLSLERAKQRMADLFKSGKPVTPLDFAEAQNSIDEAQVHIDEVREKNKQLQQDAAEAAQKGIEGNDKVVKAKEGVADATYRQQQSEQELVKTQRETAEANLKAAEQLKVAQDNVAKSQNALNKALRDAAGPMAQLAQMFADLAAPLAGPLHQALADFEQQVRAMAPAIREGFGSAAALVKPFTDALTGLMLNIVPGVNTALKNSVPIVEGVRDAMRSLGTDIGKMFADMSQGATGLGNAWRYWGDQFGKFLDLWGEFIGKFSGPAAESLNLLFQGINNLTEGFLKGLGPALQQMAGGTSLWYSLFTDLGRILEIVLPHLGAFSKVLSDVLAPVMDRLAGPLGVFIAKFLDDMTPLLIKAAPWIDRLANGLLHILDVLEPMIPDLAPFAAGWAVLNTVMKAGPIREVALAFAILGNNKDFLDFAKQLQPYLDDLKIGFKELLGWLKPMLPILGPLAAGWFLIDAAMDANPVVLMAGGIMLLGSGIAYLATQTHVFQDIWAKMPDWMKRAGTEIKDFFFKKGEDGLTEFQRTMLKTEEIAKNLFEHVKQWAMTAYEKIAEIWEKVKKVWQTAKDYLGPSLQSLKEEIGKAFTELKDQWDRNLKPALEELMDKLGPLWDQLKPFVELIGVGLLGALKGFVDYMSTGLVPSVDIVMTSLTSFVHLLGDFVTMLTGILEGIKGIVEVFWNVGKMLVGGLMLDPQMVLSGWDGLKNGLHDILDGLLKTLEGFFHVDTLKWGWSQIAENWHLTWDDLKADWTTFLATLQQTWTFIGDWLSDHIHQFLFDTGARWSAMWTEAVGVYNSFADTIKDLFEKSWSGLQDYFTGTFVANITGQWDTLWSTVTTSYQAFTTTLSTMWQDSWNSIVTFFNTTFVEGVTDAFSSLIVNVKGAWDKLKDIFTDPVNVIIRIWNDDIVPLIPGLGPIPEIHAHADGGPVRGSGGSREDKHLIAVSNREYVINAEAATRNRQVLDAINYGGAVVSPGAVGAFADGGSTDPGSAPGGALSNAAVARALAWAQSYSGKPYNFEGWIDCSGFASGVYDSLLGRTPRHDFSTMADFTSLGFVSGSGGVMDIGVTPLPGNAGHMAVTLAGHRLESGGPHNSIAVDGPAIGANDPQFSAHYFLPGRLFSPPYGGADADGKPGAGSGGGIMGTLGGIVGGVVNSARNFVSDLFQRLTNPILSKIPDPFLPGGVAGLGGSLPKAAATKGRDDIANWIRGKESASTAGGPIGGAIPDGQRKSIIDEALRLTGTPPPDSVEEWERGINTLVERESGWNSAAINLTDSNAAKGVPSKGLAQVIDPTFAAYAAPGHTNIWEPVDNVSASINYIKNRYGSIRNVQQANANMPPRGYEDGTDSAQPGWAWVGEKGPELVQFTGGEQVIPNNLLNTPAGQIAQQAVSAGSAFVGANITNAISEFTGVSDFGGPGTLLGALTHEVPAYFQTVGQWAQSGQLGKPYLFGSPDSAPGAQPYQGLSDQLQGQLAKPPENPLDHGQEGVPTSPNRPAPPQPKDPLQSLLRPVELHFHTEDMQGALKQWQQHQREHALGFDPFGNT